MGNLKYIGTVDFHGSVDVTDPCYRKSSHCRINDIVVKNGLYKAYVVYERKTVQTVEVVHESIDRVNALLPLPYKKIGTIGVDAGLAGFFHDKPDFETDSEWMAFCSKVNGKDYAIVEYGVCSVSGYGDGMYPVYAARDKEGNIIALRIRYEW